MYTGCAATKIFQPRDITTEITIFSNESSQRYNKPINLDKLCHYKFTSTYCTKLFLPIICSHTLTTTTVCYYDTHCDINVAELSD